MLRLWCEEISDVEKRVIDVNREATRVEKTRLWCEIAATRTKKARHS
jgi:hypothetical protein